MILLEKASFSFGYRPILHDVSLLVPAGARVGLVGRNGAGKTTFFRLALGELALDAGTIQVPRQQKVAFLPQHPRLPLDEPILHHVLESHPTLWDLEDQILRTEEKMSLQTDPQRLDRLVERHRVLSRQFEAQGGYDIEARVTGILMGLGFNRGDLLREIGLLSPGEKNRVALAKVLLATADLLLLDEPTNHLDFEMLEWLEEYLRSPPHTESKGAVTVVVASHDRYFLNSFADHIVELRDGQMAAYHGDYDDFVRQRAEELERQEKEHRLQQAEIAKDLEFIRRNFAAQKARQAKSREKKLARMELVESPTGADHAPRIRFDSVVRAGDDVLRAQGLSCGYGERILLGSVDLEIRRGDRLALLGSNGCGKTTLLRCIVGDLAPLEGRIHRGARTVVGYYEQELSRHGSQRTIFDEIHGLVPHWTDQSVRDLLASFLFRGDEIFVPTASLSGGEKARVALIRLILSGANLLVLDEPTNHLDVYARGSLEETLLEFPGSILFVSHDRYFVERLATRVLAIREGRIDEFAGGYAEYRDACRRDRAAREAERENARQRRRETTAPPLRAGTGQDAEEARIFRTILALEADLRSKQEESSLEVNYRNAETMRRLKKEMADLESRLEELYRKWESLES